MCFPAFTRVFLQNDVRCAKTRYFALKTRFKHTIDFNAMKALGKTSVSLRLNAFFSKNDVRCAKTRYYALKTRFMHTIGFNAMKALGMVQMH